MATRWFATPCHGCWTTQYLLGRGGVPQDDGVAAYWYERAAIAGHWGAQYLIASMYEHGNGVGRDVVAALRWYERAQSGGDEVAPLKVKELRLRLATTGATEGLAGCAGA
jgi:TPR repeat protein